MIEEGESNSNQKKIIRVYLSLNKQYHTKTVYICKRESFIKDRSYK